MVTKKKTTKFRPQTVAHKKLKFPVVPGKDIQGNIRVNVNISYSNYITQHHPTLHCTFSVGKRINSLSHALQLLYCVMSNIFFGVTIMCQVWKTQMDLSVFFCCISYHIRVAQPSHLKEIRFQTSDSFLDQLILERWEQKSPKQTGKNLTPKNDLEAGYFFSP